MELFEAFKSRYSCRKLSPVEIPKADIEKMLNAGRVAPSGSNKQSFCFLVITDRETINEFAKSQEFITGASMIIALVADPSQSDYWLEDISASATQMLLAVTALGYGGTWVQGTIMPNEAALKKLVGVDENLRMIIALPIGKPTADGRQPKKRPLEEMARWEKWK